MLAEIGHDNRQGGEQGENAPYSTNGKRNTLFPSSVI
jgi:hypothetical protein